MAQRNAAERLARVILVDVEPNLVLPATPFRSLDEYIAGGGGRAVVAARERGREWVLDELERSGLRGRGGAGFPAARKWRSVLAGGSAVGDRYVVANGAEGEPGTFKDRPLMRANPYQVLEGLSVAAIVLDAREAFLALKTSFESEIAALERALEEMAAGGVLCEAPVTLVGGPEEYLFGEEKALLEVIEGNEPMPRWLPPYLHGLFATTPQEGWSAGTDQSERTGTITGSNPTLVSNVETLANVPLILNRGASWYRSIGTRETPGSLICSVVGDVTHGGYREVEPGTTVREVIEAVGGGVTERRAVKAVLSGVSNPVLTADQLATPISYEGFAAAGSGLGSCGFVVYDDTRSMLAVARMISRFLYVESCGQCRACKYGCGEITRRLDRLAEAQGELLDIKTIGERLQGVTDQNRCFLGEEEQRVVGSMLRRFPEEFVSGLEEVWPVGTVPVPKIVDIRDGIVTYDESQVRKQPDWTYSPA